MKEHTGKLYKVINNKNNSMNGEGFDWTKHLPTKNKPGKWTPRITNPEICSKGYHLTKHWNFWINTKTDKVFECEAKNITEWDDDKCICGSVRLIKEVKLDFKDEKMNTGDWNTGKWNTGDWNTGDWNTGSRNTGKWNTGNWNTGSFNTKNPEYYELFNQKITKKEYENISFPNYFYFELEENKTYKECWNKSFKEATLKEIEQTIKLPNFNYEVFWKVTGITKKEIMTRLK